MFTWAPFTTAPVGSVTRPSTLPAVPDDCAKAEKEISKIKMGKIAVLDRFSITNMTASYGMKNWF
jgi:hypothetical protein